MTSIAIVPLEDTKKWKYSIYGKGECKVKVSFSIKSFGFRCHGDMKYFNFEPRF